jgi:hypothetical protein
MSVSSLAILLYIPWVWRFEDLETPAFLALGAVLLAMVALIAGLVSLPLRKSIASVIVLGLITYLLVFTKLSCCEA